MMILTLVALIVIVSIALWRSSKQQKQKAQSPNNRYKPQPKAKRVKAKKSKTEKTASAAMQTKASKSRAYRTEAINLHHPAAQTDDIEANDAVLGVQTHASATAGINGGEAVLLYLTADSEHPYKGRFFFETLLNTGLELTEHNVFAKFVAADSDDALFQVLSMKQPGTFPDEINEAYTTPGLVFYLDPMQDQRAFMQHFDVMLSQISLIQSRLGGHIFTPEKVLLEPKDFKRYADYLCQSEVVA